MTQGEKLSGNLAGLVGEASRIGSGTGEPTGPQSPARKEATGNIRNLKQMGLPKFLGLVEDMHGYVNTDPEAWQAVQDEKERRGL